MAQAIQKASENAKAVTVEQVLIRGDVSALNEQDRIRYYHEVCTSLGLNPLTQPFAYITLNNKLTLYALRACTDQLRTIHNVSVVEMTNAEREGVYIVTAKVQNKDGRTDIATGAVNINGLKGEALANQFMKCETKAKRRATLSICGLGMLDESELDTMPDAARTARAQPAPSQIAPPTIEVPHNPETGEIGPHEIEVPTVDQKPNWIAWGGKLIAAYKSAANADELIKWAKLNTETIEGCEAQAPKAFKSIMGAYAKRMKELPAIDPLEPPEFLDRRNGDDDEIPF